MTASALERAKKSGDAQAATTSALVNLAASCSAMPTNYMQVLCVLVAQQIQHIETNQKTLALPMTHLGIKFGFDRTLTLNDEEYSELTNSWCS